MRATLLFRSRNVHGDGAIIEIKVWRVPLPVSPSTHTLKCSPFYGYPGERRVGHDNERGKGDHKHVLSLELPCTFISIEQLFADFRADAIALGGPLP